MIEAALFKQGMRRMASGVSIITTSLHGERFGLVATSVCSLSMEPPSLLVCVNRSASSHDAIQRAGSFCINLLQRTDDEIARRFSSAQHRDTRFMGRTWGTLATGAPALLDGLASFDCETTEAVPANSHTIFIGKVIAVELWQKDIAPLIYLDGHYLTHEHPR